MTSIRDIIDPTHRTSEVDAGTIPRRRVIFSCLAIVSVAAAVIHFAVAGEHFEEYWVFGVFMLVVAWLQLLWSIGAVARPSRWLMWSGTFVNAAVVGVYVVTRTAGDVIGPTPKEVEPFGFGDGLCTVLEAVVVVGCICLLFAKAGRPVGRRRLVAASVATGVVAAVLLSVALVDGGSEMVMSMGDGASTSTLPLMHMSGMSGMAGMSGTSGSSPSDVKLASMSPAGDITMPDANMQMEPGMQMASATSCTTPPTKAQQRAAVTFVDDSWAASSKYQSLAAATTAGYIPITPTGRAVVHYLNPAYYRDTVMGGPVLDTSEPQSLVYANTPHGAVLAAAMYISAPSDTTTPQPGGCLTQWHVHTNLCLSGTRVVGTTTSGCPTGSSNRVTPPMLHVWFIPIPGGPTAVDAPNRQVVEAAEAVSSPVNPTA